MKIATWKNVFIGFAVMIIGYILLKFIFNLDTVAIYYVVITGLLVIGFNKFRYKKERQKRYKDLENKK